MTKIPAAIQDKLEYVRDFKDRSQPLVFVGRHEEMKFLRQLVDRVRRTPVGPAQPKGALRLIHGIPGTGKSALMDEFVRRIGGAPPRLDLQAAAKSDEGGPSQIPPPPPVLCVELTPANLAQPPLDMVRAITSNVIESQAEWQLAQIPKTQIDFKVALNAVSRWLLRGASWDDVQNSAHGLQQSSPLQNCLSRYAKRVWPPGITIVLVIDEVQDLKTENENTKDNMQCLFAGRHGARMPVLCFGLSNAGQVLDDLSLSRPATQSDRQIGCLNPGEGRMVIEGTMREIGLDIGNEAWLEHLQSIGMTEDKWEAWRTDMADVLTKRSADFPQHLAVAHIALCEGILSMKQGDEFDDVLRDTIVANHLQLKRDYYKVRLDGSGIENHQVAMGAISELFRLTQGAPMLRDHAEHLISVGGCQTSLSDVLATAIGKGLLGCQRDLADRPILPAPIPSLQTHLERSFADACRRRVPSALAMRTALNKIASDWALANETADGGFGAEADNEPASTEADEDTSLEP